MSHIHKRILLKLSGEQLAGSFEHGIDPAFAAWLAHEIDTVVQQDIQVIVMIGGGNFVRGARIAGHGIKRVTADQMGMLGTMINALALADIFEANGVKTQCMTNIIAEQVAEPFVHRIANRYLNEGRVVIIGGGIGRPYLTTDTAAVSMALELECGAVLKATKVDGVYEADPALRPDAHKIEHISYQDAIKASAIKVMDKAAIALAMDHKMPIVVFNPKNSGQILTAAVGQPVGTIIS